VKLPVIVFDGLDGHDLALLSLCATVAAPGLARHRPERARRVVVGAPATPGRPARRHPDQEPGSGQTLTGTAQRKGMLAV